MFTPLDEVMPYTSEEPEMVTRLSIRERLSKTQPIDPFDVIAALDRVLKVRDAELDLYKQKLAEATGALRKVGHPNLAESIEGWA